MSEAIELFKKDGTATGVFYCSECRVVFKTEGEAQQCHGERLCECGKPCDRYRSQCPNCDNAAYSKRQSEREFERYSKAVTIKESEYDGDHIFHGDKYYDSIEDILDDLADDEEASEYVWACKDIGVKKAHLEWLTENIMEGLWEDADESDLNGVPELEAAIEVFNKANETIRVWEVDYKTAVLVESKKADVVG